MSTVNGKTFIDYDKNPRNFILDKVEAEQAQKDGYTWAKAGMNQFIFDSKCKSFDTDFQKYKKEKEALYATQAKFYEQNKEKCDAKIIEITNLLKPHSYFSDFVIDEKDGFMKNELEMLEKELGCKPYLEDMVKSNIKSSKLERILDKFFMYVASNREKYCAEHQ